MNKEAQADVLKVPEIARRLRVSESFTYRLIRQGKIPVLNLGGALRVPRIAFEAMLAAGDTSVEGVAAPWRRAPNQGRGGAVRDVGGTSTMSSFTTTRETSNTSTLRADFGQVLSTLDWLHPRDSGEFYEVRIPKAARFGTISGIFRAADNEVAAREIVDWAGFPEVLATYVTLNPVHPDTYARPGNGKLRARAEVTTSDDLIIRRTNTLIDIDAVRIAGVSSTDSEHDAALARADQVRDFLAGLGFATPLEGDSGNGSHLIYKVDLSNDAEATRLIRDLLEALDRRFSDDKAKIDTTVCNAARITKVFGTPVRKGADVPERPWRLARIRALPGVRA